MLKLTKRIKYVFDGSHAKIGTKKYMYDMWDSYVSNFFYQNIVN